MEEIMVILMRLPEFVDDEHTAEVYDDLIDYIADMIDRGARVDAIGQVLIEMAMDWAEEEGELHTVH
jgi:hypothetical protein